MVLVVGAMTMNAQNLERVPVENFASDMKTISFGHEFMNQLLHDDQSNWKLYIARIKHAYTQLANYNLKKRLMLRLYQ